VAPLAYTIVRWKNVLISWFLFHRSRTNPEKMKQWMMGLAQQALGPDYDVAKHFSPRYNPWDQRLCLVPDGDLFRAIRSGKASMVTDEIDTFTDTGVRLRSGQQLQADIIVTATGLNVQLMGGMQICVDNTPIKLSHTMTYKGMMYADVPNLAASFGYTNASWTLKADLTAEYVCRLLNYMDVHQFTACTPRRRDTSLGEEPAVDLTSGYIQRALDELPKQGSKRPWRLHQNYALDLFEFRFSNVDDGIMEFTRGASASPRAEAAAARS
jgi:cation diffusion facilitator CzcD-associated flavoprotein CzcO